MQADICVMSEYALTFALKKMKNTEELRRELEEFGTVEAIAGKASITLVGKGVSPASGFLPRVFRALSDTRIFLITYGASKLSLSLILEDDKISQAVNQLHQEFFR
jgi:aspartokinase